MIEGTKARVKAIYARHAPSKLAELRKAETDGSQASARIVEGLSLVSRELMPGEEFPSLAHVSLERLADMRRGLVSKLAGRRVAYNQKCTDEESVGLLWPEVGNLQVRLEGARLQQNSLRKDFERARSGVAEFERTLRTIQNEVVSLGETRDRVQLMVGQIRSDRIERGLERGRMPDRYLGGTLRDELNANPESRLQEEQALSLLHLARGLRVEVAEQLKRKAASEALQRQVDEAEAARLSIDWDTDIDTQLSNASVLLTQEREAYLQVAGPVEQLQSTARAVLKHLGESSDCPACAHDWGNPAALHSQLTLVANSSTVLKAHDARVQAAQQEVSKLDGLLRERREANSLLAGLKDRLSDTRLRWEDFKKRLRGIGISPEANGMMEQVESACARIEFGNVLRQLSARVEKFDALIPGTEIYAEPVRGVEDYMLLALEQKDRELVSDMEIAEGELRKTTRLLTRSREEAAELEHKSKTAADVLEEDNRTIERFRQSWSRIGGKEDWSQSSLDELQLSIREEREVIDRAEALLEEVQSDLELCHDSQRKASLDLEHSKVFRALHSLKESSMQASEIEKSYRTSRVDFEKMQILELERAVSSLFGRMQANHVMDAIVSGDGEDPTVLWKGTIEGVDFDPSLHFSTGQRQDLALSLFLARARSLGGTFFLDEPLAHLDDLNRVGVLDTFRMMVAEQGASINLVVTTASRSLMRHMAEKFGRIDGGPQCTGSLRIVELAGTPKTGVYVAATNGFGVGQV